ncbi:MAG: RIP metalloprotease RseP [Bacteroidales bacterium]|jgi:regulator of sigma E protease|nr:RIP metalloprotease RseP [Bacteroidales bacterium]
MNGLTMALQLILGLSVLVFIHELGHYLAARMFGIRVDKFYLFFDAWGVKLLSFKIGKTEYGIGWLPLGGYCKIAGMIDESLDKEAMAKPAQKDEYRSKPAWQRFIVVIAGVVMNLVLGIAIFAALLLTQEKSYLSMSEVNRTGIYASPMAREAGLQNGDKIIAINGSTVERFADVQSLRLMMGGTITVLRDGIEQKIVISDTLYREFAKKKTNIKFIDALNYSPIVDTTVPEMSATAAGLRNGDSIISVDGMTGLTFGEFREHVLNSANDSIQAEWIRQNGENNSIMTAKIAVDSNGYIGIIVKNPYVLKNYNLWNSIGYGTRDAFDLIIANARGLGKIFSGKEKATESLQGPIGIATIYGSQWVWVRFWRITGMLSLILAFMNILPIPGLDGGHVLFTVTEMITRRKPSDKFLESAQKVGMFLLIALMVFVIGNDLFKIFFK